MACPKNGLILYLLQDDLPPVEKRETQQHIEGCPSCRTFYADLQEVWDALGTWEVVPPEQSFEQRIMEMAGLEEKRTIDSDRRIFNISKPLRGAASLILALGLGVLAGSLVPAGPFSPQKESRPLDPLVEDNEVLVALGMEEFAVRSATGLPLGLGEESSSDEGEE